MNEAFRQSANCETGGFCETDSMCMRASTIGQETKYANDGAQLDGLISSLSPKRGNYCNHPQVHEAEQKAIEVIQLTIVRTILAHAHNISSDRG